MDIFQQFFGQLFGAFNPQPPKGPDAAIGVITSGPDGGQDWLAKAFPSETPEWAPWHPDYEYTPMQEREERWAARFAPPQQQEAYGPPEPYGPLPPTPDEMVPPNDDPSIPSDDMRAGMPMDAAPMDPVLQRGPTEARRPSTVRVPDLGTDTAIPGEQLYGNLEATPTSVRQSPLAIPANPAPPPSPAVPKPVLAPTRRMRLGVLADDGRMETRVMTQTGPRIPKDASYQVYALSAPSYAERAALRAKGGITVNLDTNWRKDSKPTTPMVVIPDNSPPGVREAAFAYAKGIADIYQKQFGVRMMPTVVTRSQNGRGRPNTVHTEPFSVNDVRAVDFFTTGEGLKLHAQLLRDTFGKLPNMAFSLPHDPTMTMGKRRDMGAVGPRGSEVDLARILLAELMDGGVQNIARK